MKLDEFVRETLTQIAWGVHSATPHLKVVGTVLNPDYGNAGTPESRVTKVEFDVAVTTTEGTETKGEGGITVAGLFNVGGHGKSDTTNTAVSRIRFAVPILFPAHETED